MAREFARKFYRGSAWQDVRLFVLCRDKWKCRRCDAAATEVYHRIRLTPENIHDAEIALDPDNLIALCTSCHIAQHKSDRSRGRSYSGTTSTAEDGGGTAETTHGSSNVEYTTGTTTEVDGHTHQIRLVNYHEHNVEFPDHSHEIVPDDLAYVAMNLYLQGFVQSRGDMTV